VHTILGILTVHSEHNVGHTHTAQCTQCWAYTQCTVHTILGILTVHSEHNVGHTHTAQCTQCWAYSQCTVHTMLGLLTVHSEHNVGLTQCTLHTMLGIHTAHSEHNFGHTHSAQSTGPWRSPNSCWGGSWKQCTLFMQEMLGPHDDVTTHLPVPSSRLLLRWVRKDTARCSY